MNMIQTRLAWPLSLACTSIATLCTPGCRDDADEITDGESTSSAADSTGDGIVARTYWQDVAPIYFERCVTCHRDGGSGPFVLDDYATASQWAAASANAVSQRTMPPWLATDDGTCGSFADSRALTEDEITTIVEWFESGTEQGTPRNDLVMPEARVLATPGSSILDLSTPSFAPVAEGTEIAQTDEYRCFTVDAGAVADRLVTGYEVLPGNDALVHHVLLFEVDPSLDVGGVTNGDRIAALDAESPDRDGWPCFGATGEGTEPSGVPVSWAPGQGVTSYPDGVGYRIASSSMLVAQIHYNLAGQAGEAPPVSSTVRLRTVQSVEREAFFQVPDPFLDTLFTGEPVSLEPGREAVDYTWEIAVDDILGGLPALDLYGVLPHMHSYGRSLQFDVVHADGSETCGVDVQRWDFDWQLYYFYEEALRLLPGDTVRVRCTYDTTSATEPVLPGWGTNNEMCLLGVFMAPVFE